VATSPRNRKTASEPNVSLANWRIDNVKAQSFAAAEFLDRPDAVAEYLTEPFGDKDAAFIARGDKTAAKPNLWVRVPKTSSVEVLRQRLGMTQAEIAAAFHAPISALREWEQHQSNSDAPTRALLPSDRT